ncbi:hypothetical protein HHI36_016083 [Cryptolaemus montrouzieri]|uniref:Uncharacterized protein n=1 Tax=Cryptolaemus montrouzieri TaxID=559131 RepID=A0ABD2N912_9CUCU
MHQHYFAETLNKESVVGKSEFEALARLPKTIIIFHFIDKKNPRLSAPSRDLLERLLEKDPTKRLRSLRSLTTIAFFKDYQIEKVKEKTVSPKALLQNHYPNGPRNRIEEDEFEDFDSTN